VRELAVEIARYSTSGFPGSALGAAIDAVASADGLILTTPVFSVRTVGCSRRSYS